MRKLIAIINLLAGTLFSLVGGFVVLWCGSFLTAAPRDHVGDVTWALIVTVIGIYLVIAGLGRVRLATVNLNQRRQ